MPRLADQVELGAGDQVDRLAHQIGRGRAILVARDAERRQAQAGGGGVEIGARDRGGTASIAGGRLAHEHVAPDFEFGRGAEALGKPALHHRVGQAFDAARIHRINPLFPHLGSADLGPGVGQDHGPHEVEPLDRQTLRDHPADGQADEDAVLDPQQIEQPLGVAHQRAHRVGGAGFGGETVPALVVADEFQPLGQQRQDLVPEAQVGAERIGEDHRCALRVAVDAIVQPDISQIGYPHGPPPVLASRVSKRWGLAR